MLMGPFILPSRTTERKRRNETAASVTGAGRRPSLRVELSASSATLRTVPGHHAFPLTLGALVVIVVTVREIRQ